MKEASRHTFLRNGKSSAELFPRPRKFSAENFLRIATKSMSRGFFLIPLFILIPLTTFAYTSPGKPVGYVNDFAGIVDTNSKQAIQSKLQALNQSTGIQVSVVTVKSLGGDTVENYAVKLFEEWGIGDKKKSNGLLLLIAVDDREVKIETGYGIGGVITDLQSSNIIRKIITPAFQAGKYGEGIDGAVDAIISIVNNSADASVYSEPINNKKSGWNFDTIAFLIFFLVFPATNILARFLGKTKSWWLGGVIGAGIGLIIGLITASMVTGSILLVICGIIGLVFDYIVSENGGIGKGGNGASSHGFWLGGMGGGHGGFGGGGGFGGFGGGMSGGGGASGKW